VNAHSLVRYRNRSLRCFQSLQQRARGPRSQGASCIDTDGSPPIIQPRRPAGGTGSPPFHQSHQPLACTAHPHGPNNSFERWSQSTESRMRPTIPCRTTSSAAFHCSIPPHFPAFDNLIKRRDGNICFVETTNTSWNGCGRQPFSANKHTPVGVPFVPFPKSPFNNSIRSPNTSGKKIRAVSTEKNPTPLQQLPFGGKSTVIESQQGGAPQPRARRLTRQALVKNKQFPSTNHPCPRLKNTTRQSVPTVPPSINAATHSPPTSPGSAYRMHLVAPAAAKPEYKGKTCPR